MKYLYLLLLTLGFTSVSIAAGSSESIDAENIAPPAAGKPVQPILGDMRQLFAPLSPQRPARGLSVESSDAAKSATDSDGASQHSRSSGGSGAISVVPVGQAAAAAEANPAPVRASQLLPAAAGARDAMEEDEDPASLAASADAPVDAGNPGHAAPLLVAVAAPFVPAPLLPAVAGYGAPIHAIVPAHHPLAGIVAERVRFNKTRAKIRLMSSQLYYRHKLIDFGLLLKWSKTNPRVHGVHLPLCAWILTTLPTTLLPAGASSWTDHSGNHRLHVPGEGVSCQLCGKTDINYPYVIKHPYEPRFGKKLVGGECMAYATRSLEDALEACGL